MRVAAVREVADEPELRTTDIRTAEFPVSSHESLLDEFADDEDATIGHGAAGRGVALGVVLGAAFWAAIFMLITRH